MLRSLRAHKAVKAVGPDYTAWFLKEAWFESADIEWSEHARRTHAFRCACGLFDPGCVETRLKYEVRRG